MEELETSQRKLRDNLQDLEHQVNNGKQTSADSCETLDRRINQLEREYKESIGGHDRTLEELISKVNEVQIQTQDAKSSNNSLRTSIDERLVALERQTQDVADKSERGVESLGRKIRDMASEAIDEKNSRERAISDLELRYSTIQREGKDTSDSQANLIGGLEGKLKKLHTSLEELASRVESDTGARDNSQAAWEERLIALEQASTEFKQQHDTHIKHLEAAHTSLRDLHSSLAGEKTVREVRLSTVEEQLQELRRKVDDEKENTSNAIGTLDAEQEESRNGAS